MTGQKDDLNAISLIAPPAADATTELQVRVNVVLSALRLMSFIEGSDGVGLGLRTGTDMLAF